MKKDVGIITWHYYANFGSALQAYALQTTICNLGYSCEFIDYRKQKHRISKIKELIKYTLSYLEEINPNKKQYMYSNKYILFQYKYLYQSKRTYNAEILNKYNTKYKVFVCGSDQIWAPNVFDAVYFLSFVDNGKPKIAYAPSIGLNSIPTSLHNDYCNLLDRFDCLSIREEKGAELIKNICNRKAEVVLDPTFLLDKVAWENLAINPIIDEDYILCYFLGENKIYKEVIQKISSYLNCKIISVSRLNNDREFADFIDRSAGPREFLGYVKKAKMIFTDSFHGLAFSINFNKNFYVFERFSDNDVICQNSRIYNILDRFGLRDHLIKHDDSSHKCDEIEYSNINMLLEAERKKSIAYLNDSISQYCKVSKI